MKQKQTRCALYMRKATEELENKTCITQIELQKLLLREIETKNLLDETIKLNIEKGFKLIEKLIGTQHKIGAYFRRNSLKTQHISNEQ